MLSKVGAPIYRNYAEQTGAQSIKAPAASPSNVRTTPQPPGKWRRRCRHQ
ncbi:hypothetical protein SynA1840_01548 [Synechococcus sp. A18-40]|nr:hypothetical protein SynA1840_01548 [Synechococcus sp. A18-40]